MRVFITPEFAYDGYGQWFPGCGVIETGRHCVSITGLTKTQLECVKACLANLLSLEHGDDVGGQEGSDSTGGSDGAGSPGPAGG